MLFEKRHNAKKKPKAHPQRAKAKAAKPNNVTGHGLIEYTIPADAMQDQFCNAIITGPDGTKAAVTLSFDDSPAFAIDFAKRSQAFTSHPRIVPGVEVRTDGGATAIVLLRLADEAIVRIVKPGDSEPVGLVTSWPIGQLEPTEFENRPELTVGALVFCVGGTEVAQIVDRQHDAIVLAPFLDFDQNVDVDEVDTTRRFTWTINQLVLLKTALPVPMVKGGGHA